MTSLSPGYIWVRSIDQTLQFFAYLGENPPKVTAGGYGGWNLIPRPRRRSLTEWGGSEPVQVEIEILFDRFAQNMGVETEEDIRTLERMAGLDIDGNHEPPLVQWNANGPHDYHEAAHLEWFVEDIDWGDAIRNSSGNRIRQYVTVHLRQHVTDTFLETGASANRNKNKKTTKTRIFKNKTHYVHKGETLQIIARDEGHPEAWKDIKKLNKIRDSKHPPVGKVIKLP